MKDYKKILEGVIDIISTTEKSDIGFANICTYIGENCPELKESEDERIRKELLQIAKECEDTFYMVMTPNKRKHLIAWLEKQGEKFQYWKPSKEQLKALDYAYNSCSDTERGNYYEGVLETLIDDLRKLSEKQGEQKPAGNVEPKFKVGQTIKKEGFNSGFPIVKIENGFYYNDMGDNFPFTDQDSWELVEQKPAWSEEGEKLYNRICGLIHAAAFENCETDDIGKELGEYAKMMRLLKSLKDRYTWMPSDEQMEALESATENCAYSEYQGCLRELIEQLKKLRDEDV